MDSFDYITSLPPLPARPLDGHKGLFGRVLVVGGSEDMIGAPALAGLAALRLGSGLVQIAMPRSVLAAALCVGPELVGLGLGSRGVDRALVDAAEKADALMIGPGMGQSPAAAARLLRLVQLDKPAIVDADALNILATQRRWPAKFALRAVLTPHPGEMARLMLLMGKTGKVPPDDAGRTQLALEAARSFGPVVVLKGHRTIVTDGQRVYINSTGDSTLSKAGSGDVLSGMLGCLLGQQVPPFDAAILATYLHGRAGELAGKRLGRRCALARDVIDCIPSAVAELDRR